MFSRPAQGAAAHGRGSRRFFGVAGDLFLEPLEHLAQRHDFGLELLDALRQLADICRLRDAGRLRATHEGDADLVAVTPVHLRTQRLLLLWNVEVDDVGDRPVSEKISRAPLAEMSRIRQSSEERRLLK
jgi:hypothetical protein